MLPYINYTVVQKKSNIIADARYDEMLRRGHRTSIERNREQWLNGFLAEEAVSLYLRMMGKICSGPDLELRENSKRIMDADLESSIGGIGVKCDLTIPYSWGFQKSDTGRHVKYIALVHRESKFNFTILGLYDKLELEAYYGPTFKSFMPPKKSLYWQETYIPRTGETIPGVSELKGIYHASNERERSRANYTGNDS